jgi:hypothetical protein
MADIKTYQIMQMLFDQNTSTPMCGLVLHSCTYTRMNWFEEDFPIDLEMLSFVRGLKSTLTVEVSFDS